MHSAEVNVVSKSNPDSNVDSRSISDRESRRQCLCIGEWPGWQRSPSLAEIAREPVTEPLTGCHGTGCPSIAWEPDQSSPCRKADRIERYSTGLSVILPRSRAVAIDRCDARVHEPVDRRRDNERDRRKVIWSGSRRSWERFTFELLGPAQRRDSTTDHLPLLVQWMSAGEGVAGCEQRDLPAWSAPEPG